MTVTDFLSKLAVEAHYSKNIEKILAEQPLVNQMALARNDSTLIYNQFADLGYLASPTTVVMTSNWLFDISCGIR